MHELSIADALIQQVVAELDRAGQTGPVKRLELAVGRLSGVHCDALRFGFQLLAQGTPLEGVELSIRQPPAVSRCRECGRQTEIMEMVIVCPACSSSQITIEQGRDLLLETIEIEDTVP